MSEYYRLSREVESREKTLPPKEGFMVIPSEHLYGVSDFHLCCSDYGCGTCDGGGCETCHPIYVREPKGDG